MRKYDALSLLCFHTTVSWESFFSQAESSGNSSSSLKFSRSSSSLRPSRPRRIAFLEEVLPRTASDRSTTVALSFADVKEEGDFFLNCRYCSSKCKTNSHVVSSMRFYNGFTHKAYIRPHGDASNVFRATTVLMLCTVSHSVYAILHTRYSPPASHAECSKLAQVTFPCASDGSQPVRECRNTPRTWLTAIELQAQPPSSTAGHNSPRSSRSRRSIARCCSLGVGTMRTPSTRQYPQVCSSNSFVRSGVGRGRNGSEIEVRIHHPTSISLSI